MERHGHQAVARENATFRLDGDGLAADERQLLREQWAAHFLTEALRTSSAFGGHVQAVAHTCEARERVAVAWQHAVGYGQGGRCRVVARILLFAAEDPRWWPARVAIRVKTVTDDRPGRKGTYRIGDAFAEGLERGAGYIARQGAGLCLADGCASQAAPPAVYCRRHDAAGEPSGHKDARRRREVRRVFELASPAILAGPRLPLDLEIALDERQRASARRPPD